LPENVTETQEFGVSSSPVTIHELFSVVGLKPSGPVPWEEARDIKELSCGIYVVTIVKDPYGHCGQKDISPLSEFEQVRWLHFQPVIYIGRTKRALRQRLREFHRHVYGNKDPHRGGQSRILVDYMPQWVFYAATPDYIRIEDQMIRAFRERVGKFPYANRRH
jgi:hypothetical protein